VCSEGAAGAAEECTAGEVADEDAMYWFCSVLDTLPNGNVVVSVATGIYSVQVGWNGLDEDGNTQGKNVSATFIP
jgi:hypothetical protein